MRLSWPGALLRNWLAHPLANADTIDDSRSLESRRRIIDGNPFLQAIYADWYSAIANAIPPGSGAVLEVGSSTGFLSSHVRDLIKSDVMPCAGLDVVLDGRRLPFRDGCLRAIAMTNVLHHVPDVAAFLGEAARCIRVGGVVVMIEPWVTPWSRFVYRHLHSEPFVPEAASWMLPAGGPMSVANGALPWIVFVRDRARFEREHPGWTVTCLRPFMPFRYLVSGGVSLRPLMPSITTPLWRLAERATAPWSSALGMFAFIILTRIHDTP